MLNGLFSLVSTIYGTIAWALEGIALWVVLLGFGVNNKMIFTIFIYVSASVIGAFSMLPGGVGAYAYEADNQVMAVAVVVGAISLEVIYKVTSTIFNNQSFKPLDLKVDDLEYLGEIDNKNLLAHKALETGTKVCAYLRNLDLGSVKYNEVIQIFNALWDRKPI